MPSHRSRRSARAAAACALALAVPLAATAASTPPAPVSVATATATTYAPGDRDTASAPLRLAQGGTLMFANLDPLGAHTLTATDVDAEGRPLFTSPVLNMNEAAPVAGAERLAPGIYAFFCEVHNPVMQGVLEVVPSL